MLQSIAAIILNNIPTFESNTKHIKEETFALNEQNDLDKYS